MEQNTYYGYNAYIVLEENGVRVKPGTVGFLLGGGSFLNEKFIPYSSISGIEFRKGFPIIGEGSLTINTRGEVDSDPQSRGKEESVDYNIIKFSALSNERFEEATRLIESRI